MVDEAKPPPPPPPARGSHDLPRLLVLLLVLGLLLTLSILIFLPFVAPIVIALVVSPVAYPLFARIHRLVGMSRRGLASFLTCLVLVLAVFLPLAWLGWSLLAQAQPALDQLKAGSKRIEDWGNDPESLIQRNPQLKSSWERLKPVLQWIGEKERAAAVKEAPPSPAKPPAAPAKTPDDSAKTPDAPAKTPDDSAKTPDGGAPAEASSDGSFATTLVQWMGGFAAGIVSNAFQLLVKFVVMLYILFFFFKDGPRIAMSLKRAIPLAESTEERVWRNFRQVSRSIIRGSFGTAAIQGLIAGIAFAIVGIPAVFWGVATALASLIPPLGTALILVPASAYLLFTGSVGSGIFIGVIAAVVGILDNIIRPLLMQGGVMVHEIWLLLAILGGLNFFGPMGLIYGPMVLVLLGTFVQLFVEEERSGAPQAKA